MATAVISAESAFLAFALPVEAPELPEFIRRPESRWDARARAKVIAPDAPDENDEEPAERKLPERRANLGWSLLLCAVEDYRSAKGKDFESAKMFLFPVNEEYRAQLRWAIDLAGLSEHHTRLTLDHLRPRWDAERKKLK